jgi:hypothetical protein
VKRYFLLCVSVLALLTSGCATSSFIKEFTSDGCSLFPDGTFENRNLWCECCYRHDIAYWKGGTEEERIDADNALRNCVLDKTGSEGLAETIYAGVRLGGGPEFPTWYRWGYGWQYSRGYKTLTEEEQIQSKEKLDEYLNTHPSGYCN